MEIKIDGEVIILTPQQAAQFKRAIFNETKVPPVKPYGGLVLSCKTAGKSGNYPFVLSSNSAAPTGSNIPMTSKGKDFSLIELKSFIMELKRYASQIWTTAEKELKNV